MVSTLLGNPAAPSRIPPRRLALAMLQLLGPEGAVVAACLSPEARRELAGAAELVHLDDPTVQSAFTSLLEEVRRPAIAPLTDADVSALIADESREQRTADTSEAPLSLETLRRLLPTLSHELGAELLRRAPSEAVPQLLKELPREHAASLLLAIVADRRLPKLQREFLGRVTRRLSSVSSSDGSADAMKRAARLIGAMGDGGEQVLAAIREANSETAAAIAGFKLRLVDIPRRLNETGMREVLRRCNRDDILLVLRLLKSLDREGFETLISMQSKRLAQQMREEIDAMEPQPRKVLADAENRVMNQILSMIDRGEIELPDDAGGGDDVSSIDLV